MDTYQNSPNSPASQDHLCSPYLLHPSEVCLLQGIDSWLCKSSKVRKRKHDGWPSGICFYDKISQHPPRRLFLSHFFGIKTNRIFFSKRTTKSFPTTVSRLKLYFGCGPPNQNEGYYKGSPSKKMNASWPLLTGRLRHAIHHRPSSIIKSSHHFIIEIYGALGHPLMPLPPRTQALTRDY